MGYFRGVIHGTVIGTVIGICLAPQDGARTRAQIQSAADQARSGARKAQETARTVMPAAQTAMRTMAGAAERIRHREETEPYVSVDGSGNGNATVRRD